MLLRSSTAEAFHRPFCALRRVSFTGSFRVSRRSVRTRVWRCLLHKVQAEARSAPLSSAEVCTLQTSEITWPRVGAPARLY